MELDDYHTGVQETSKSFEDVQVQETNPDAEYNGPDYTYNGKTKG